MKTARLTLAYGVRAAARRAARAGDWQSAAERYQRLVRQGVATARDRVQLAHSLKESGDIALAEEAYQAAAAAFPRDIDAQLHYGLFLRHVRQSVEAVNVLARALVLDPGNAFVRAELLGLGIDDDMFDTVALTGIVAGYDAPPTPPGPLARLIVRGHLRRARRYARAHRWDDAARQYRRMLAMDPHNPRILVQLGHAVREQGDAENAVMIYRDALVSEPRRPDVYLHLGHALKATGRRTAALQAYLAAWRLQPGMPSAAAELHGMGWTEANLRENVDWSRSLPQRAVGDSGHEPKPQSMVMPNGLTRHQQSIWMLLAASVAHRN